MEGGGAGALAGEAPVRPCVFVYVDRVWDPFGFRLGLYLLYLDVRGEMDSSIAIRTLLFKDGQVSCWGGGGIVADSNWQAEYQESLTKVDVLLRTLEQTL